MVKQQVITEISNELVEQIVMTLYPSADVYAQTKDGDIQLKHKYEEVRVRIENILDCNLNKK